MRSSRCCAVITRGAGGLWPAALGTSSSPRISQKPEATKANSPNATTGKSQRARDTVLPPPVADCANFSCANAEARNGPGSPWGKSRVAPRPAGRPADKARGGRISGIFDRGATQSAGLRRGSNAVGFLPRACMGITISLRVSAPATGAKTARLFVSADSDETVAGGETDWRSSFLCSGIPAPEATLSVTGAVLAVAASSWEENTPFVIGCSVAGISPEGLSRTRKSATFSRLSIFSFRTCRIFSGRTKVHPPVLDNLYSAMGYVRCVCQSTSMDFPS